MLDLSIPLPRDEVAWFAGEMERMLRKNDHKSGWDNDYLGDLLSRMREEARELRLIVDDAQLYPGSRRDNYSTAQLEAIIREAADVANFAMMIADNARLEIDIRISEARQ